MTQRLGLLGRRIDYSLSPRLHLLAAAQLGLDCSYELFDFSRESDLRPFLAKFWDEAGVGLNVTQPYKTFVASLLDEPLQSSVNTLYRGQSGWQGASTDGLGFERAVERLGCCIDDFAQVIFLGSGGAVQGILHHLAVNRDRPWAASVHVFRRHDRRDAELIRICEGRVSLCFHEFCADRTSDLIRSTPGPTLVVQATSAPLHGDELSRFVPALELGDVAVYDLVYGQPSALVAAAVARGSPGADGLSMLIEQARASQKIWWGQSPSYEELHVGLMKELGQRYPRS